MMVGVDDCFMANGCRDMLSKHLVAVMFTDRRTRTHVHTRGRRDKMKNTTVCTFGIVCRGHKNIPRTGATSNFILNTFTSFSIHKVSRIGIVSSFVCAVVHSFMSLFAMKSWLNQ